MQIQLKNAGLKRQGHWLVRGIDLTLNAGQIVTLIGPNGAGKSSTVKMALGLEALSEGSCERQKNLTVGYVPQRLQLDWTMPMSVERFMHLTPGVDKSVRQHSLDRVGLAHCGNRPIADLSGGEFQRMLIARAIARKPDVLVLDEPTQGIDVSGEAQIYELISQVRDELNCGVLLISHDLHLVMAATDTVLCLNGHLCCHGSPSSVAASEEYQHLFGVDSTPNLAVYDHHHNHTHGPDGTINHG